MNCALFRGDGAFETDGGLASRSVRGTARARFQLLIDSSLTISFASTMSRLAEFGAFDTNSVSACFDWKVCHCCSISRVERVVDVSSSGSLTGGAGEKI